MEKNLKEFKADVSLSFEATDKETENSRIFKEGEFVNVLNYKVDLNAISKITLEISKEGETYFTDAQNIFGTKIGNELKESVSSYMGWLFGNPIVVEQIVNFHDNDVSMSFWKESNKQFHENLRKIIKVRHISSKFGL
jgi:hypothetical protein